MAKKKIKQRKNFVTLERVHPHAAALDIGAAVPPERSEDSVRCYGTFTVELEALADWLIECGVDTVAMESTGVYWIPVFEILEARGLKAYLVNARHVKNVPGRKSDFLDCQWLQQLHSLGLLNGSFRPDTEMVAVRAYLRHRAELIEHRAPHTRSVHMQKALQQMNLQLHHVFRISPVSAVRPSCEPSSRVSATPRPWPASASRAARPTRRPSSRL